MKLTLNLLLSLSAIIFALTGLATLFAPQLVLPASVLAGASSLMILPLPAFQISTAILNWIARSSEASKARDAIVLFNTLLYVGGAIFVGIFLFNGGPAFYWLALVANLLLAGAFVWVGRTSMSAKTS